MNDNEQSKARQNESGTKYGREFAVSGNVHYVPMCTSMFAYRRRRVYATSRDAACDYITGTRFPCIVPKRTKCSVYSVMGNKILAEDYGKAVCLCRLCYGRRSVRELRNSECGAVELARRIKDRDDMGPLRSLARESGLLGVDLKVNADTRGR